MTKYSRGNIKKNNRRCDAIIGIDISEFLASTMDWTAEDYGVKISQICQFVLDRKWSEIEYPFRVLLRGTASRPSVSLRDRKTVISAGKCAHCRTSQKLTVDHIIPLARGGAHDISNFQCLCAKCNREKWCH
jgi:5-methylcytosine-specific restriction endonuclease McrA